MINNINKYSDQYNASTTKYGTLIKNIFAFYIRPIMYQNMHLVLHQFIPVDHSFIRLCYHRFFY
jgi:hypothetical protein